VLLSGKFFGGISHNVLNAAAAIEMLHNASLIHDDVIDRSKERRGAPTINSIWDNHIAVLVGDYFVGGALKCAVNTGDVRILNVLSRLGTDLSIGEIDQIEYAQHRDIDEQLYMRVIGRKTASLFTSCVEVGGLAAGATDEVLNDLKRFAQLLGLCFQIKDDTFDYFNNPTIGKPTGNDLREGKITLPLIYALGQENLPEHDEMIELVHKSQLTDDDILRLVDFAKTNGGIEYAHQTMERLRAEAEAIMAPYQPNETISQFNDIFRYIIDRNK
jgi:octaprenyl-diphosphate synthase